MLILGLQKTTLLDYPEKLAATVFTGGCDLRCPFCHNSDLVLLNNPDSSRISEDEFFSFLQKRKNTLQAVCITGGEPTLQQDLIPFIEKIKALNYQVKLDTNGFHPELLAKLIKSSLIDYCAIDIKNSFEKYALTVGKECDLELLKESISILHTSNIDYEFRTTVVKEFHEAADIDFISKYISFAPHYYLQSFIDSGNTIQGNLHPHTDEDLKAFLSIAINNNSNSKLRGI